MLTPRRTSLAGTPEADEAGRVKRRKVTDRERAGMRRLRGGHPVPLVPPSTDSLFVTALSLTVARISSSTRRHLLAENIR
jgi:hypothetical protein